MSPTLWTVNSVGFKLLAIYFFQKTMNSHLSPPSDLNPASSYIPKFIKELKRTNHAPNIQRFFQDFHHKTLTFVWSKVQSTPHIRGMFIAYNYNSSLPSFLASKNRFTRVVSAERREEKPISAGMGNDEKMEKHAQYERVFKHFDDNGDGKISASELQGHCGGMTLEEAEAAVESLDSDGDGLLELGDLVRLVEGVDEEERTKDLEEAFKVYENDGCGCITPKSLKRMLSRLGESRSIDECIVMISQFDLNGDGVLNFDEFKVMML